MLAFYILRYTRAVKRIQRNFRSFLQCRRARILCVLKIWDDMEQQFIKVMGVLHPTQALVTSCPLSAPYTVIITISSISSSPLSACYVACPERR